LQHTIANQANSAMKNNVELSEIIDEIPSQINILANQALNQMAQQQEITWIEQSKKQANFSTCAKDNRLCVKIIPNQPYDKNGEYALLDILKGKN
jgi:hypothetical protein